jgi:hypothetical protein
MFSRSRLLWQAAQTIRQQTQIIVEQHDALARLETEKACAELAYMRISRDLIEQFLIALDMPENNLEYRDRLSDALGFYRDEIAVREEHLK